jgi:hypothetical protein
MIDQNLAVNPIDGCVPALKVVCIVLVLYIWLGFFCFVRSMSRLHFIRT